MLSVNPAFEKFLLIHGFRDFESFWEAGNLFKAKKKRAIYKFQLEGKNFFVKKYFSLPLIGKTEAFNEWAAAKNLSKEGFRVPTPVAFGIRRQGLRRQAFTVFLEAEGKRLEDIFRQQKEKASRLVVPLATFAARFHRFGFSHQDFYLCHIFWDEKSFVLIDLQRVRHRRRPPLSWLVKDIAQLFYAAQGVLGEDFEVFFRKFKPVYTQQVGRTLGEGFWCKVERKLTKIARHDAKLRGKGSSFKRNGRK